MTDDELIELIGPRTITHCVERKDGGWDVTFSCGHLAIFAIQPVSMELLVCAQCLGLYLEHAHSTTQ